METKNYFILKPRLKSWVIVGIIFLLSIFPKTSTAQEEHPDWIAYDIGKVWFVDSFAREKDTLWIAALSWGLIKLNIITHEYLSFDMRDYGLKRNWAESIVVDNSGNKWFLTKEGLMKFDGTNWTIYDTLGGIEYETIISSYIKKDNKGNIWVKGGGKIAKYDGQNWVVHSTIDSNSIYYNTKAMAFDSAGHIWASTEDTINFFNKIVEIYDGKRVPFQSDSIYNYINNPQWKSLYISHINIDNKGVKWVTVQDSFDGECTLIRIVDESNFTITLGGLAIDDYLPSNFFGSLAIESDSSIWIGGNEYFRWYNGAESFRIYTFRNGITDDCVDVVYIDENGNKWLSVRDRYKSNDDNPCYIVAFREGGVNLGVDNDSLVSQPQLYPNPASDYVYINSSLIDGVGGVWQYQIYDILGNCVQDGMIESDKINISQLSAGFYTVRFFNGGKQVVEKLMKE